MTVRQQWAVVSVIVAALALGLGAAVHLMGDQLFPVDIGGRAPDFRAKELGRDAYKTLAAYKGQVVLLNIWATWCEPCKVEMPSIEHLYESYGGKGLRVVAVSIDDAIGEDSIAAFARDLGLHFEVLHDQTRAIDREYQTTGWPETFLIGKDGIIRKKVIGAAEWDDQGNRALIAELLGLATAPVRTAAIERDWAANTPGRAARGPRSFDAAPF